MFMTLSTRPWAASTLSSTRPPLAWIEPLLATMASSGWPSGPMAWDNTWEPAAMLTSPSPNRSMVKALPDARDTVPRLATMAPEFSTPGATSAARPPSATVMVPRLTTDAVESLAPEKLKRPSV